jgi:hypothetical protein
VGASPHGVTGPTRVRATSIISYLVIQFSSPPVQSTLPNSAGDNLVLRGSSSSSAVMSPQSGIGSGSTTDDLIDAILRHLDSIEEKLHPLGCHLAGMGGNRDGALHTDDDVLGVGKGNDAVVPTKIKVCLERLQELTKN